MRWMRRRPKLTRSETAFWFSIGAVIGIEVFGGLMFLAVVLLERPERWLSISSLPVITVALGVFGGWLGLTMLPSALRIRQRYVDWKIDAHQINQFVRWEDPVVPAGPGDPRSECGR